MKEIEMEKMETVKVSSESEGSDENGENGVAAPKKRGRPPKKGAKMVVVKEKSGRGRGRPPMNPDEVAERLKKAKEQKSVNGIPNRKRGRPKKAGGHKVQHAIVATGKGRGRPKADNGENDSDTHVTSKKKSPNAKGGRGRPKKEVSESDEGRSADEIDESNNEDDDDEEEVRPVGRPSTGAVNLNIERTGRGQGRQRKEVAEKRAASEKEESVPKKRGRPAGNSASKPSTGKPRGRPKSAKAPAVATEENSEDDDENEEVNSSVVQYESNVEDDELEYY